MQANLPADVPEKAAEKVFAVPLTQLGHDGVRSRLHI